MTSLIAITDLRLIYGAEVRPLVHADDEELAADLAAMVMSIIDPVPAGPRPIVPPRP